MIVHLLAALWQECRGQEYAVDLVDDGPASLDVSLDDGGIVQTTHKGYPAPLQLAAHISGQEVCVEQQQRQMAALTSTARVPQVKA